MTLPFINAKLVYQYLAIQDPLTVGADAIFILGSGSVGPVITAARLFHDFASPHLFFTSEGGAFGGNVIFGRSEVEEYASELASLEIPAEHIHFPPEAERTTNTLAEALVAILFMDKTVGPVQRVILCSRSVHQRRASATFRKQNPHIEFINQPDNELLSVELLPRLVQEVDRLRQYGAKGDLEMQEIPEEVNRICEEIRAHCKMPKA